VIQADLELVGRTTWAISCAISSIVKLAVLRAILSASDGLAAMTSALVIPCQIGRMLCSPGTLLVTSPSSSYCGQFLAKKTFDRMTIPNLL
jgi:hypothetical protein